MRERHRQRLKPLCPVWTAYGRSAPLIPWPRLSRSFPITRHGSRKVITRRTGNWDRAYALAGYNWFGQESLNR